MTHKERGAVVIAAGAIATVMLLITLTTIIAAIRAWPDRTSYVGCIAYLAVFWAIAPPVWFFFEYYYLWDRQSDLERLKHGQAVAGAIWLAILGIVVGYLNTALK